MSIEEMLSTAHIHLEHALYRIHVADASKYPIERMNEEKPSYVLYVAQSLDPDQAKQSLLINAEECNLGELAAWVRSYETS